MATGQASGAVAPRWDVRFASGFLLTCHARTCRSAQTQLDSFPGKRNGQMEPITFGPYNKGKGGFIYLKASGLKH